jgi:hypothetical protein
MEQLIRNFKEQSISQSIDIDSICDKLSNTMIEYDEYSELFEFLNLKMAGKSDLIKTDERYVRYLRGIDIWIIGNTSYEYIRDNIILYLSLETNNTNLIKKLKLMRTIDLQLKGILDNI